MRLIKRGTMNQENPYLVSLKKNLLISIKSLSFGPVLLIAVLFACHQLSHLYADKLIKYFSISKEFFSIEGYLYSIGIALSIYWLLAKIINYSTKLIQQTAFFTANDTLSIVLPFLSSLLKILLFLMLFNSVTQSWSLPHGLAYSLDKVSSILIIGVMSLILFKVVDVSEQLLLRQYRNNLSKNVTARRVYTQTTILKRIAYTIILTLTAGAILMLFENVRALGASMLTTAGIVGLVITFTAQRSLANLFSGLEMALTQPIKIGDSVVIDNEMGTIEEINFRNVIVKLWDWRRLVVPTSFFLEKSFQNWSREENNNLIGIVDFYMDFTLPVAKVREELNEILASSPLWDKKVGKIEVYALKENVMQLRVLASACNAEETSALRGELREKLITYIAEHYPESLPGSRSHSKTANKDDAKINQQKQSVASL